MAEQVRSWWRWRHLFVHLVRRDLRIRYRRSFLGPLWLVVDPLVLAAMYTFVFSYVFRAPVRDYPLFLMAGLLPWIWFSTALTRAVSSLARDANLIRRSAFPLELLPLRCVTVTALECGVGMLLLVLALWTTGRSPDPAMLHVIPLMVLQGALTAGLAMVVAIVGAVNRDVDHLVAHGLRLLFFATPIAYAIDHVPSGLRPFVAANPLAWLARAYRCSLLGDGGLGLVLSLRAVVGAFFVLAGGWVFFRRRAHLVPEVL